MEYERDADGDLPTKLNGRYHSFDDKPAIIKANGDQYWYKEGRQHRDSHFPGREDDLPAVICANGDQHWYKEGERHRENDLPAIIYANGDQYWYKEHRRHRDSHFPGREDDLPAVILANGGQHWYKEGVLHRDGGLPAILYTCGRSKWFINGKYIRSSVNYNSISRVKSARNI